MIGALRHRITLENPVRTDDGGGGGSVSWQPVATLWAAIRPLRGAEYQIADRAEVRVTHEIRFRFRTDVTGEMRLRKGNRLFHIHSVLNDQERNRWSLCLCEERDTP